MPAPPDRPGAAGAGRDFPLGAAVRLADLAGDPHPVLARLREQEPVSWLPALGGWLVSRWDLATAVLRDSRTFTVDDPRFTTARVVGPSMLSLDGADHTRHRAPFAPGLSRPEVERRLAERVAAEAERLARGLKPAGAADLARGLAAPLATATMRWVLGLDDVDPDDLLSWYDAIVAAVSALAGAPGRPGQRGQAGGAPAAGAQAAIAGRRAFSALSAHLGAAVQAGGPSVLASLAGGAAGLTTQEIISNAAVMLFGGIETTEGMIGNALRHLLSDPGQRALVTADPELIPAAVEESLRLEPAAAMVDRYATRNVGLGGAQISRGDLVSVSLAGAGRDPAVFADPDRFDVRRPNPGLHLAFARGPHFCLGAHLARLEAECALRAAVRLLPGLRLDTDRAPAPRGLVFRKPTSLPARWDRG